MIKTPLLAPPRPGAVKFDNFNFDGDTSRSRAERTSGSSAAKMRKSLPEGSGARNNDRQRRGSVRKLKLRNLPQSVDGNNYIDFYELRRMQGRFDEAASVIQDVLGENIDREAFDVKHRTARIASQLAVWKDDVAHLLETIEGHIVRCKKLENVDIQVSHQSRDAPIDARRKKINEFALSLKADLVSFDAMRCITLCCISQRALKSKR